MKKAKDEGILHLLADHFIVNFRNWDLFRILPSIFCEGETALEAHRFLATLTWLAGKSTIGWLWMLSIQVRVLPLLCWIAEG